MGEQLPGMPELDAEHETRRGSTVWDVIDEYENQDLPADPYVAAVHRNVSQANGLDLESARSEWDEPDFFAEPRVTVPRWMKTGANEQAWKNFKELDADGSGYLDEHEATALAKRLGLSGSKSKLRKMFKEIDPDGSGEITFAEFCTWFNAKREADRRETRLLVREIFDRMDNDGSGALNKEEIQRLVSKTGNKLQLQDPPFDMDHDWGSMYKTASGEVTFNGFETWWKKRTGVIDPDIPVLPEFITTRIDDVSKPAVYNSPKEKPNLKRTSTLYRGLARAVSPRDEKSREGKEMWRFLRPRLRLIVEMQKVWGSDVHDLYSRSHSLFTFISLPPMIVDPDGGFAAMWDVMQIIMLMYVSVTVPLRVCFDIAVPVPGAEGGITAAFWADMVTDVYFICDVIINFRTAYFDKDGVRESRTKKIASRYLNGWFSVDFVSCLPISYVVLVVEAASGVGDEPTVVEREQMQTSQVTAETARAYHDTWVREGGDHDLAGGGQVAGGKDESSGLLRGLKILRLVRLSKMLRLTRLVRILKRYQDDISSYIGVYGMLLVILLAAHFLACFWYLVGTSTELFPNGDVAVGWVHLMEEASDDRAVSWLCHANVTVDPPCDVALMEGQYGTKYIHSMFAVFNALEQSGETSGEKAFAIFATLVVGFIYGALAGVMSQVMASMKGNEQETTMRVRALKAWMTDAMLPKPEQHRVLSYFEQLWHTSTMFSEAELLEQMPPSMSGDMARHLYCDAISTVPLFMGLQKEIINALCQVVVPIIAIKDQCILTEGECGSEMYMVIHGEVEVKQKSRRLGFLSEGAFFGEVPLLEIGTGTEIRTRTIVAVTECKLCYLTREALLGLRAQYPALEVRLRRFQRIGQNMHPRKAAAQMSDLPVADMQKIHRIRSEHAATRAKEGWMLARRSVDGLPESTPKKGWSGLRDLCFTPSDTPGLPGGVDRSGPKSPITSRSQKLRVVTPPDEPEEPGPPAKPAPPALPAPTVRRRGTNGMLAPPAPVHASPPTRRSPPSLGEHQDVRAWTPLTLPSHTQMQHAAGTLVDFPPPPQPTVFKDDTVGRMIPSDAARLAAVEGSLQSIHDKLDGLFATCAPFATGVGILTSQMQVAP